MTKIRTDLDFTEELVEHRVIAQGIYRARAEETERVPARQTSLYPAKTLDDAVEYIEKAIRHYEEREHVTQDKKVNFSWEFPNKVEDLEMISVTPGIVLPGVFERTHPTKSREIIRNRVPVFREELEDPDVPGYRRLILGFLQDNWLTLTCWARTNKAAHSRATWLETVMEEYLWFFTASGIKRIIYEGRQETIQREIHNNLFVGYPVEYYVQTERITNVSEKTLEQIVIEFGLATS